MIKINNIPIFDNIDPESKKELERIMTSFQAQKKETLFYEKEFIDNLYFIEKGKVSIYKINENGERKVIFILKNGDMINELSLDQGKNTIFACEVFEKSTILKCPSSEFLKIMEKDFNLMKNILLHTQNINRRLYRQLKNSTSINIDKKLAAKLYRMGKEFGVESREWTIINANISITYIAEMLGCKRETVSRAMKQLQDYGLVKIINKNIYIKKEGLSRYFKDN
jgi:CRP-like cAMP-binding protein